MNNDIELSFIMTEEEKERIKKILLGNGGVRKESNLTGLNACGYWYACDYCDGSDLPCACANAMLQYFHETGKQVDFKNTNKEYLDKLLRGEFDE